MTLRKALDIMKMKKIFQSIIYKMKKMIKNNKNNRIFKKFYLIYNSNLII